MRKGRPFIWILFFFLIGILSASNIKSLQVFSANFFLILCAFLLLIAVVIYRWVKTYSYRWFSGLISALALISAGISITLFHLQSQNLQINESNKIFISGEIISEPTPTTKSVKFILKPIYDSLHPVTSLSHFMIFLKKDSNALQLRLGDYLVVQGKISPPEPPLNPEEFDYTFYLKTQGVNRLLFASQNGWEKIKTAKSTNIKTLFAGWRNYLLETLQKNELTGEEYGVAAAILLGNDQMIDPDTEQNYVAAGAVHILCVSGMHVGIIFLVLNYLLGFVGRFKRGNLIKNLLLFALLWSYALLTGLSPSVLRATVMISFFILANALNREYDSYNLLAASAFLLLVFNPFFIFHVGFQLSYSAVLGILTFYNPIYRSIYIKNKIIDLFWAALVVSLSAQLGAFPVAAHYFHVFPVYFLLTNLFIFILSYLILSLGFGLLITSWIPLIPKLLGIVLSFTIKILNVWVQFIAGLPFSQVSDLYFPWGKVFVVYALIIFIFSFIILKKWKSLLPALVTIAILLSINLIRTFEANHQKYMMIYAVNQHPAVSLIQGNKQLILTDSTAAKNSKLLTYNIDNYRIRHALKNKIQTISTMNNAGLFRFNNKNYYLLQPDIRSYPLIKDKILLFAVVYWGKKYISLQELNKSFQYKTVILSKSIPIWVKSKIMKEAKKLGIVVIDIRKTGAIEIDKKNEIFSKNSLEN